jgi:hypothetical protein
VNKPFTSAATPQIDRHQMWFRYTVQSICVAAEYFPNWVKVRLVMVPNLI